MQDHNQNDVPLGGIFSLLGGGNERTLPILANVSVSAMGLFFCYNNGNPYIGGPIAIMGAAGVLLLGYSKHQEEMRRLQRVTENQENLENIGDEIAEIVNAQHGGPQQQV